MVLENMRCLLFLTLFSSIASGSLAQNLSYGRYDIGSPTLQQLWIDPISGDDSNSGNSRQSALRTVTAAWNRIPSNVTLTSGFKINLLSGNYSSSNLPNYWENRRGSASSPIILEAVDGAGTAVFRSAPNIYNTKYLYILGVSIIPNPAGDAFHCEKCDHILLRNMIMNGGNSREAHETVKVNQSRHIYIENCDISGADDNAIDFVSVQYGHVILSKIHNAGDWCAYAKGGSAYLRYESNEIYDCGTGGFTAGQGTGFEFMEAPWLHYEAYDLKIINNVIHDTEGAGLGVNGGYNILMAHNTLYKVGSRSHVFEAVFGARSCDGNLTACRAKVTAGGWGPRELNETVDIPNRNIFFLNNLIYNPAGFSSQWQHFTVNEARSTTPSSNVPSQARADLGLIIRGNVIWNGAPSLPIGVGNGEGCDDADCNETQIESENSINQLEPQLVNPENGDFRPLPNGNLSTLLLAQLNPFQGQDRASPPLAPEGVLSNLFDRDFNGSARIQSSNSPGAFIPNSNPSDGAGGGNTSPPDVPNPSISGIKVSAKSIPAKGGRVTVSGRTSEISKITVKLTPRSGQALSKAMRPKNNRFSINFSLPRNKKRQIIRWSIQIRGGGLTRNASAISQRSK